MIRHLAALARVEVMRCLMSRRWIGVAGIWCLSWFLVIAFRFPETVHQESTVWDIYLSVMNNWMTVGYLLLPGFVFLVSDVLTDDMRSGYAWLELTRTSRSHWWIAKVAAVVGTAFVYQLGFIVATAAAGSVSGFSLGGGLPGSAPDFAAGISGIGLFPPISSSAELVRRVITLLLHQSLAFAAISLFMIVLTLKWRNPMLPLASVVAIEILDWVLSQRVSIIALISPGRRLIEGIHLTSDGIPASVTWISSALYFTLLLGVAAGAGWLAVQRVDC